MEGRTKRRIERCAGGPGWCKVKRCDSNEEERHGSSAFGTVLSESTNTINVTFIASLSRK